MLPGIWYGSPYIELSDSSHIASSTGFVSVIEYKGKGYFSGKSHSFKASIYPPLPGFVATAKADPENLPQPSTTAKYVAEGTWVGTSKLKTGVPFTDVTGPRVEVQVADIETQDEYESRRLWREVARGIRTGDFELASREKSKIEVRNVPVSYRLSYLTAFAPIRTRKGRNGRMRSPLIPLGS
jgi:oxysterol-binding protein-related protein 9/10/11